MDNIKNIEEAIEMATLDACDEYEQAFGWLACFEEVFDDIDLVKINGIEMKFIAIDLERDFVPIVICELNGKQAKVIIDSVEFLKTNKTQKIWLEAWKEWSN